MMRYFIGNCFPLTNLIYASTIIDDSINLLVLDMAGTDLDILLQVDLNLLPIIEVSLFFKFVALKNNKYIKATNNICSQNL